MAERHASLAAVLGAWLVTFVVVSAQAASERDPVRIFAAQGANGVEPDTSEAGQSGGYESDEDDDEGDGDDEEPALELEAELELLASRLSGFALDTRPDDDLLVREAELAVALTWRPRDDLLAFGEIALIAEREDFADDTPDESVDALERGETWIRFLDAFDTRASITLGRPAFEDPRRWWWDDDLDAVRLDYESGAWDAYVGLAEELAPTDTSEDFIDPEEDEVRRLFGHLGWKYSDALRLDGFALVQRDRSGGFREGRVIDADRVDESDLDADWLGLRVSGAVEHEGGTDFRYWGDLARISGDETLTGFDEVDERESRAGETTERRLRGWAVDLGTEWTFEAATAPSVSLRYAEGSGDRDPDDGTDRNYRETGLRDTDDEFRLYGELLRPELSNLRIGTVALGFEPVAGARLTLGYHRFRQVHAADELAESRIGLDPTGDSPDIGDELSVVVQYETPRGLELEFAAGVFRAGNAFGAAEGERAHSLFGQLTYGF